LINEIAMLLKHRNANIQCDLASAGFEWASGSGNAFLDQTVFSDAQNSQTHKLLICTMNSSLLVERAAEGLERRPWRVRMRHPDASRGPGSGRADCVASVRSKYLRTNN
jgi:hypothetical protein